MNAKKKSFIISLALSIIYGIYILVAHGYNASFDGKNLLWRYLTLWDYGTEGISYIVILTLCMAAIVLERYKEYYNHFDKNCVIRIGMKKYLLKNIKEIMIETLVFMMILHTVLFLFNSFYFHEPFIMEGYTEYCHLTNNQISNVIFFIILSCLGAPIINFFSIL